MLLNIVFKVYSRYSARAMTQVKLHNSHAAGMADIPSAVFIFNEDLACQLEIKDFSYTEVFIAIENDRVSISQAVVYASTCSMCYYF